MANQFKRKQSVRKGVKRLLRRDVQKALEELRCSNRLESVHEVRKEIKQMRALLRLVRTAVSRADYRRASTALREAAGYLSAARDSHVKVNALEQLTEHFKRELAPRSLEQIKKTLSQECRRQQAELSHKRVATRVRRRLQALSRHGESLSFKSSGWAVIGPGIQRSYREGRRGYLLSRKATRPEALHEWRKRVKDLYYQVNLLCPIWPEQMMAVAAELKHLGERLGDDHDLFLLIEPGMFNAFRKQAPEEAEALKALVDERQTELRAQALAIGARFYLEKPAAFCKRLGQYWKRWRHEPKHIARAALASRFLVPLVLDTFAAATLSTLIHMHGALGTGFGLYGPESRQWKRF
jgi:CHAD domain-containing protein